MFDKLIESGTQGRKRTAGPYLLAASAVYFLGLITTASLAIMWFNPGLVEALELNAQLPTPPPMTRVIPKTPTTSSNSASSTVPNAVVSETQVSRRVSATVLPLDSEGASRIRSVGPVVGDRGVPGGDRDGVLAGMNREGAAPPPPPREAAPTPAPAPARPVEKSLVSEGVLRGIALNKFTPPYPEIAKRAAIQGQVQVQVLISEDGRVIEASVLNGHPLLRNTARDAARRWVFSATKLSGVPVKVQGILTFDFKLN